MNLLMKKIVQKSIINYKKRGGELEFSENKVHPSSVKLLIYSIVILLFSVLFFSCGIASYPVLYDPLYYQSDLTFWQNPDNKVNPDFISLGYDIIYRIYDNNDYIQGTISDTIIQNEAENILTSSILSTIISKNSYSGAVGTENSYSYNRLRYEDKSPIPIYKIVDSIPLDTYPINLFLNSSGTSYIQDNYGNKVNFIRNLGTDTSTKYFTISDFSINDSDVPGNYDNNDGDGVRIAFFAFTYGLTVDLLSLSGKIVYIGSIVITS